ncbi:MAG: CpaF family protein [Planctomycetes bacterium]|nr:CpaF family protein [Planctomycetota bacterium]
MDWLEHPALAPLRPLLEDPQVTEIMINGPQRVFVERGGVMGPAGLDLGDAQQLDLVVGALLQPTGRTVSASHPYVDFRLPDGSRGNVIVPPLAVDGPAVTIRKFTKTLKHINDLVRAGTLSRRMAHLLAAAVRGRANIVFSGATGTGKTTTLNILSRFIPETERIVTIEDTAELTLQQKHVVRLECRRPNVEGKGEVTVAQLLRNALRMRPTRIIVGEIRGDEAVDMLQAISSGHQGCLAVLHASSPLDAVSRLEMMCLSRGLMLPLWAVHKLIASAVDLIVQHDFATDGTRRVTRITECAGLEGDAVALRDLFAYHRKGADASGRETGEWAAAGTEPRFLAKCAKLGFKIPPDVYAQGADPTGAAAGPAEGAKENEP